MLYEGPAALLSSHLLQVCRSLGLKCTGPGLPEWSLPLPTQQLKFVFVNLITTMPFYRTENINKKHNYLRFTVIWVMV